MSQNPHLLPASNLTPESFRCPHCGILALRTDEMKKHPAIEWVWRCTCGKLCAVFPFKSVLAKIAEGIAT